jgi:uncharacterized protein YndB with AHSA1/START domain
MAIPQPEKTGSRPNQLAVRVRLNSNPRQVYAAWTTALDRWFAVPGTVRMDLKPGGDYSFDAEHEGKRQPHHGRFLRLEKDSLIEMTWTTGAGGTEGAETVLSIELAPEGTGTLVDLKQSGFPNEESLRRHDEAWPWVLSQLDKKFADHRP